MNIYDPTENPLGTNSLEERCLVLSQRIQLAQMCTNIALRQQIIAAPATDAGLTAKITVFQAQLVNNARHYYRHTDRSLVQLFSQMSNICRLLDALIKVELTVLSDAIDSADARQEISDAFTAVSDEIGKLTIKFHGLTSELAASSVDRGGFSAALTSAITDMIVELGQAAVSSGNDIDRLQQAIQDNIQAIVDGADQVAGGVRQLGTGIVTTIYNSVDPAAGATKDVTDVAADAADDDDDDDDAKDTGDDDDAAGDDNDTPEKPELPDTGFAAESITAVSEGTATLTQAQSDILNDTKRLAAAYDKLANEEAWVAVAKAIQANNELYINAVSALTASVTELKTDWQKIAGSLLKTAGNIEGGVDENKARQLKRTMTAAQLMWSQLNDKIDTAKISLAGG